VLTRKQIKKLDVSDLERVHQIGILSPYNSFVASALLDRGVNFTASEYIEDDPGREKWEDMGVLYPGGHDEKFVTEDIDLIIYPTGRIPGNPECEKADKLGIPAVTVSQMVGVLSRKFKTIAIAGTHGKTTTTALVVWMITSIIGEPSFLVGDAKDAIAKLNKNWNVAEDNDYLVIESCEYKKQFLDRAPAPFISVVTNIDLDHTDYYKTQEQYNKAFEEFLLNTKDSVVINLDGVNESSVIKNIEERLDADIFDVSQYREKFLPVKHKVLPGFHNQENMLKAALVGEILGFEKEEIIEALKSFPGLTRRFELVGHTDSGNPLYKDFAHNPPKIEACIAGAREVYPDKKVILVFQPHSFERSYSFKEEFAKAISEADVVLIPNIYASPRAKDEDRELISEEEFVEVLAKPYKDSEKIVELIGEPSETNFQKTKNRIQELEKDEDAVIILASAGDLPQIADKLVN
jgi:UDP-N-acetylmuramate--alanine ligase